ncbi:MAG: PAS domain-containing protein [Sandaracinus sp.]|nr:PAS domain-containing protein [Sandaracinus sp.]
MEALFPALFGGLREPVVVTDADLERPGPRIVYVNPAFERQSGYSAVELLGKTPRLLQGPRTDRRVLARLKETLREGRPFEGQTINYHKNGTPYVVRWHVSPIEGPDGKLRFFVSSQRNVTEELRVHEQAWQLHSAVELLDELVLVMDRHGEVSYANRTARRWLESHGLNEENLVENLKIEPARLREIRRALDTDTTWSGDLPLFNGDTDLEMRCSTLVDPLGGLQVAVVAADRTESRRLDRIASALNASENLAFVFSSVRHELGNPVNSLKTALGYLVERRDEIPHDILWEYLEEMQREVGRMESMLTVMRGFSEHDAVQVVPVHLHEHFARLQRLIGPEVERRGALLQVEVPPDVFVRADPTALHQVTLNLLTNALDAVESRPTRRIRITARANGPRVQITVGDTGVGMDAQTVANLFKPFQTTKKRGTGLGLVITQRLLARMDGTIDIWSRPGEGSVIRLALPTEERSR